MPNGIIIDYQIIYYQTDLNRDSNTTMSTSALEYEITGLTAFTNYSIFLTARTVEIGSESSVITIRTAENSKFSYRSLFNKLGNTWKPLDIIKVNSTINIS